MQGKHVGRAGNGQEWMQHMRTHEMIFLPARQQALWRIGQGATFGVGVLILAALLFKPALGLHLLWNVLIPIAPLLLVLAPGLWRNVCPMGTTSLLPHHTRLSRSNPISRRMQGVLFALAVVLLVVIVPLRHVALDSSGPITGGILLFVAALAASLGFVFDSRSIWCSGLCPVYPVEVLYGAKPVLTVRNAHCGQCSDCVTPCRDSRPAITPQDAVPRGSGRVAATVLIGGFPGFIIGWYQVPTWQPAEGLLHLDQAYAWPLGGMLVSLLLYLAARALLADARRAVSLLFAAAAVSAYYWFKLPVMLGFGDPGAALVDLGRTLPDWVVWLLRATVIVFFASYLLRPGRARSWQLRPPRTSAAPHEGSTRLRSNRSTRGVTS